MILCGAGVPLPEGLEYSPMSPASLLFYGWMSSPKASDSRRVGPARSGCQREAVTPARMVQPHVQPLFSHYPQELTLVVCEQQAIARFV